MRGLRLLSPRAPQLGEGPGRLFLWQPGSKTQARDEPALLFKAIQLHRCTETALFDLNMKFYSPTTHFFPRRAREGRVVLNVHFFGAIFHVGSFILKSIHPPWAPRFICNK